MCPCVTYYTRDNLLSGRGGDGPSVLRRRAASLLSKARHGRCGSPAWSSLQFTVLSACWGLSATLRLSRPFARPNPSEMCPISSCPALRSGTFYCWWPALRWMPAATCQRSGCSGEWDVKSSPSFSSPRSGCLCSLLPLSLLTGRLLFSVIVEPFVCSLYNGPEVSQIIQMFSCFVSWELDEGILSVHILCFITAMGSKYLSMIEEYAWQRSASVKCCGHV